MKNKFLTKYFISIIVSFLFGIGVMFWYSGKELAYKDKAAKITIGAFGKENVLDKKLINNYAGALQLLWSCIYDYQNEIACDIAKFDQLTKEKLKLDAEKQKVIEEMKVSADKLQKEKMPFQR